MTASIDYLPIWKKDSTAEEWLLEVAAIARKHPERFGKVVIVAEERLGEGSWLVRTFNRPATLSEILGIMEIAKAQMFKDAL